MKPDEENNPVMDQNENVKTDSLKQEEENNEEHLIGEQTEETDLEKMEAELTKEKDKYLRLLSEFDNYKKRMSRDKIEFSKSVGSDIFLSMLPVLDDTARALKSMADAKDVDGVKQGIELIYSKMKNIFESKGVKEMESVGKPFDADLHDAIANAPAPSEEMKGKVVEEIEKGYYLNDKVIRHAKVIVGN